MPQSDVRIRLYVTRGNRKDFNAALVTARDNGDDHFIFDGVMFQFDRYSTIYTEIGIDEAPPAPIVSNHCRVTRAIITVDNLPTDSRAQAGFYDGLRLGCGEVTATVMCRNVQGAVVDSKTLVTVRRMFNQLVAGQVQPTAPASPVASIEQAT